MKRFARIATIAGAVCAACLSLCLLGACSSGDTGGEVGWTGGTATYKNDTMTVALESNPSTGFSWTAQTDSSNITVTDDGFTQGDDSGNKVGGGGTQQYTVKATANGTAKVTFTYARSWEENNAAQTVVITATIKDGKFVEVSGTEQGLK